MRQILKIAKLELKVLLFSPIAWLVLIVFVILTSPLFLQMVTNLAYMKNANLPLNDITAGSDDLWFLAQQKLMFLIPLLTRGLMNREISNGTINFCFHLRLVPERLSPVNFYAEVLRNKDKKVAEELGSGKNLFIIFNELFRGTNVKNAHDATLAVTAEFAGLSNCLFVVSTHIIEVREALANACDNIQFKFLPTILEGHRPRYTYKLTEGITSDHHGMVILE